MIAPIVFALSTLAQGTAAPTRDFEAYVWRQPRTEPEDAARVLEAIGGTLALSREPRATWLAAGHDVMLFNAPGRDTLHLERGRDDYDARWQRWYDERDDALLVREPCLTERAVRAELSATLEQSLAQDVLGLRGISIGDEVGLTPHSAPADVCLSESCRAAWRLWLRAQPGLGPKERERFDDPARFSTDATRLAFADGDTSALEPWLLRRRFHESVVRGLVLDLARQSRALAPSSSPGLLGLGAQSPFGTPRSTRILPELGFVEAYREVNARELLLTTRAPDQRVLLTVFPEAGSAARAAWDVWEHALRGGDGVVVWSDAPLAADAEVLARTAGAIESARALPADFRPRPEGVAVLHDFESVCLGWLRDALLDGPTWPKRLSTHQVATGTWETAQESWLRLLEDIGLQPGALALDAVDADTPGRFGLLVASELALLEDADLARLRAHLAAGGRLWVRGAFGDFDARGRARGPGGAFETLHAEFPGRVERVAEDIEDYSFERSRRTARARAWRTRIRERCQAQGLPLAPWRVKPSAEDLPFLCTWSRDAAGVVTGALLPNSLEVRGSGGLAELLLEIEPLEDARVEWLHPPASEGDGDAARTLPAGEALVFRLLPR